MQCNPNIGGPRLQCSLIYNKNPEPDSSLMHYMGTMQGILHLGELSPRPVPR